MSTPGGSRPGPVSRRTRYDLGRDELSELLTGEPAYRVEQVWDGLYRQGRTVSELTNVPKALRERLAAQLPTALDEVTRVTGDDGRTVKFLWALDGGSRIETVLMHYDERSTVCVSTQAGCAMACGFCATGQAGFERQLSAGEIVEQVVMARREAGDRRISNVVFMGMGEPLANYDRTWEAVHRLHDDIGIGARHLTLSTVGLVPGIRRLAVADLPVNLAVSLHAADDELRDELVPINRRYPLPVLVEACRDYVDRTRRRLSFEWAMISGVNDRFEDAARLADSLEDLARRVERRKGTAETLLFFYYSGHGDSDGLHLTGTQLPFRELLDDLGAIPVDVRILVVDACQSGELTRLKGAVPAEPFEIRADDRLQPQLAQHRKANQPRR